MDRELCGKWMPRAKAYCARLQGHPPGLCASPESMQRQRQWNAAKERPYDPVASRRWRSKHRLSRYGLTEESFQRLLEIQQYACRMCHTKFEEDQPIFIDHDHACCPNEKSSCGKCLRGLLCLSCNTALGVIERKYDLARAYLARPLVW